MNNTVRVEMPIKQNSIVISKYKTIGGLKEVYKNLFVVKYIYLDPQDNKLKGVNPHDEIPLVDDAYLTVMGNFGDIIELSKELVTSNN
ncbi:hypothetical protein ES703_35802 [subsurface metagenome]